MKEGRRVQRLSDALATATRELSGAVTNATATTPAATASPAKPVAWGQGSRPYQAPSSGSVAQAGVPRDAIESTASVVTARGASGSALALLVGIGELESAGVEEIRADAMRAVGSNSYLA